MGGSRLVRCGRRRRERVMRIAAVYASIILVAGIAVVVSAPRWWPIEDALRPCPGIVGPIGRAWSARRQLRGLAEPCEGDRRDGHSPRRRPLSARVTAR